jgi:hypothetical protein
MGTDSYVESYLSAISSFNNGDDGPFFELLAENCAFDEWASSKAEIMAGFKSARDDGWTTHHPMTVSAQGPFLVAVARNTYADGSTFLVAGALQFDDDGKLVNIRSIDNRPVTT